MNEMYMPSRRQSVVVYAFLLIFWILLLSGFIALLWYFYSSSYSSLLSTYLERNPLIFRKTRFIDSFFTIGNYQQSFWWLTASILILCSVCICWLFYQKKIILGISVIFLEVFAVLHFWLSFYKKMLFSQKVLFLLGIISVAFHQFYLYQHTFILVDETFSWLYFAECGLETTLTQYPVPNNHLLYNLLSAFWSIFIADELLAMRMTSIVSFWLMLGLIFVYLARYYNFQTAFLALLMVGLGFSSSIFGVYGRGYALFNCLSLFSLLTLLDYLQSKRVVSIFLFFFSSVLGFFCIPIFLYVFVSHCTYFLLGFFLKKYSFKQLKELFVAGVCTVCFVCLCYTPALAFNGYATFTGNANVQPNYENTYFFTYILPIAFKESVWYVFALPKYLAFGMCVCVAMLCLYAYQRSGKHYQALLVWVVVSLGSTLLVIALMRAFPFYRTWGYYSIFIGILIAIVLPKIFAWFNKTYFLGVFLALFTCFSFWQFHHQIADFYSPNSEKDSKNTTKMFWDIAESKKSVFVSEEAFYGRFLLGYWGKEHLLAKSPCEAAVAVTHDQEKLSHCQTYTHSVWFFRFYMKK